MKSSSHILVTCRRLLLKTKQQVAASRFSTVFSVFGGSHRHPPNHHNRNYYDNEDDDDEAETFYVEDYCYHHQKGDGGKMVLLSELTTGSLAAHATVYLPHLIFFLYKIGQSVFSPTTKLYLYASVCSDRYGDQPFQLLDTSTAAMMTTSMRQYYKHSGKQSGKMHHGGPSSSFNHSSSSSTAMMTSHVNTEVATHETPSNLVAPARNFTTTCLDLSGAEEDIIQMEAADYIMTMKILQDVPAFILGMFCGGWSDKVGRRLPMMLPCIGGLIVSLLFVCIQAGGGIAIPGILVGVAVNSFTGRNTLVSMAVQAYVTDQSNEQERTRQLGRILAMNFFGLFAGSFIMAILADQAPFWAVFLCVAVFYSIALALIYFALPESKLPGPGHHHAGNVGGGDGGGKMHSSSTAGSLSTEATVNRPSSLGIPTSLQEMSLFKKLTSCCQMDNFTDTLNTIIRPRPNNTRRYLLAAYLCIVLHNMCKSGEIDVLLLFVKHTPLNWTKSWYGYLLSFQYATVGLLLIFVLPLLLNKLHLTDSAIIIGCVVAKAFGLSLLAFSDRTWMVFLSNVFVSTFGMIISCLRSIVTKMVDDDETGKCFAIISSSETVSDLLGVVFFTRLYYIGLSYPNGRPLPFVVMALIHIALFGLAIYISHGIKKLPGGGLSSGGYDSLIDAEEAPSSMPRPSPRHEPGLTLGNSSSAGIAVHEDGEESSSAFSNYTSPPIPLVATAAGDNQQSINTTAKPVRLNLDLTTAATTNASSYGAMGHSPQPGWPSGGSTSGGTLGNNNNAQTHSPFGTTDRNFY